MDILDKKAEGKVPLIDDRKSPKEYFLIASGFLKSAGEYKQAQEFESAYVHLKAYCL